MDCKITGETVKNVSTDCKEVIGSRAIRLLHKKFPDVSKPSYQPTGRPSGWYMNEFVDKDGDVKFITRVKNNLN